mmetsp:Transcript_96869/g.274350  ORF Transcript_96869/g.274350 Transcript_96869/m.274350 type:complete len:265 (+) Transcript_96869:205-999(+)
MHLCRWAGPGGARSSTTLRSSRTTRSRSSPAPVPLRHRLRASARNSSAMPMMASPPSIARSDTKWPTAMALSMAARSSAASASWSCLLATTRWSRRDLSAAFSARPRLVTQRRFRARIEAIPMMRTLAPSRSLVRTSQPLTAWTAAISSDGRSGPKAYPRMFRAVISVPEANVRMSSATHSMLMPQSAGMHAWCAPWSTRSASQLSHSHWSPKLSNMFSLLPSLEAMNARPITPENAAAWPNFCSARMEVRMPSGVEYPPSLSM